MSKEIETNNDINVQESQYNEIEKWIRKRNLNLIAFIFTLLSTIAFGFFLIPLIWLIPMSKRAWAIYKNNETPSVERAVCTALFANQVAGILYFVNVMIENKGKRLVTAAYGASFYSALSMAFFLIPLIWLIPMMNVITDSYKNYMKTSTVFKVFVILVINPLAGVLLFVHEHIHKDEIEKEAAKLLESESKHNTVDAADIDSSIYHNVEELFQVVGTSEEEIEKLHSAPYSYWRETIKQLFKKPLVIICIVMIALIVLFAIIGPFFSKNCWEFDENGRLSLLEFDSNLGWSKDHLFGTGAIQGFYGKKDLWTSVWFGTRRSLLLGTVVALIDTILGIIVGSIWGYFRKIDPIMIEFRNFVDNIPALLFYFLLSQFFVTPTFWSIVFILCLFGWLGLAGFIRNQIIIIRNREYNVASLTLGSKPHAMILHNLLPYLVSVIVTVVSTAIPAAISSEVGLAFFNLSFQPTKGDITLGQLLTEITQYGEWFDNLNLLIVPLIVMIPLTISFFYIGLALADATDPKNHR